MDSTYKGVHLVGHLVVDAKVVVGQRRRRRLVGYAAVSLSILLLVFAHPGGCRLRTATPGCREMSWWFRSRVARKKPRADAAAAGGCRGKSSEAAQYPRWRHATCRDVPLQKSRCSLGFNTALGGVINGGGGADQDGVSRIGDRAIGAGASGQCNELHDIAV